MRNIQDPTSAAQLLVDHALSRFSTDNLSCMIVRFDKSGLLESQNNKDNPIGVEGDPNTTSAKPSEADKLVGGAKQKIAEGALPAIGVSATNSGRGHDPASAPSGGASDSDVPFRPTAINGPVVEEEPGSMEEDEDEDETEDDSSSAAGSTEGSTTTGGTVESDKPSKS